MVDFLVSLNGVWLPIFCCFIWCLFSIAFVVLRFTRRKETEVNLEELSVIKMISFVEWIYPLQLLLSLIVWYIDPLAATFGENLKHLLLASVAPFLLLFGTHLLARFSFINPLTTWLLSALIMATLAMRDYQSLWLPE